MFSGFESPATFLSFKLSHNLCETITQYKVMLLMPAWKIFFSYQGIMSRTSSVFFATMCLLITSVTSSAETKKEAKVLILGAGLSGITAAKTLLENNITDFYVLEGQDYIGGRIHAVQFEGVTIETGANWLHLLNDEDTAPLAKRLIETEMTGVWCNYSDVIIRLVGKLTETKL